MNRRSLLRMLVVAPVGLPAVVAASAVSIESEVAFHGISLASIKGAHRGFRDSITAAEIGKIHDGSAAADEVAR